MLSRKRFALSMLAALAGVGLVLAGPITPARAAVAALKVRVGGVRPGGVVAKRLAFCAFNRKGQVGLGLNRSPAIWWSKGPAGTKSYAIIVHDSDVPSVATDVNKKGTTLPASMPRVNFYHWVLVDIPTHIRHIPYAHGSKGVTPHGKKPGPTKYGVRGINSYTNWFATDPKMKGEYGGYDGPCPPWNDTIPHHYHFVVYALNVAKLDVSGNFTGPDALKAMQGHILAEGSVVGLYSLNKAVIKSMKAKK